ncbi:MAG: phosphoglucosamine mutase [Desulfomonilaceae bacterium]
MHKKLFGTDGIRGLANQEPMTTLTALRLGGAIAEHALSRASRHHRILVGRDTRVSCSMLEAALTAGICSKGAEALLVGIMPTPGIAFLTVNMRCDAGIVISASHNPFEDNGIKVFASDGFKLSDDEEAALEKRMLQDNETMEGPSGRSIGTSRRMEDALGRYVVFVKSILPRQFTLDGIRLVLDCANGAGYLAAPHVFEELGADVTTIGASPNGYNINDNCGSLHPQRMCELVKQTSADLGVALDGDADRVIFADERGNVVDGDQIMGLIAWDLMTRDELKKKTLVATVMSNMGLEVAMREMGGKLVRTPVGDRYVVELMRREGYNFGGEQSGHLIFLDQNTTGDGIMAALQVLRVMRDTGKPLSCLAARVQKFPQVLKNVPVNQRRNLEEIRDVKKAMDEAQRLLGHSGRLLVRYSGTQLVCRVMAEGKDPQLVNNVVQMVADAISRNI